MNLLSLAAFWLIPKYPFSRGGANKCTSADTTKMSLMDLTYQMESIITISGIGALTNPFGDLFRSKENDGI